MAGARIEITVSVQAASDALGGIETALGPEGLPPLLADIGEYLMRSTRDRADAEESPDGIPWAPLSPRYKRRKERLRPGIGMLHFDNHMLGDRFTYQVASPFLYVGTSVPYGARQQWGGGGIEPREWLGLSADDEAEIPLIVKDHLGLPLGDAQKPAL